MSCKQTITPIEQCTSVKTYFRVYLYYVQKKDPRIQQERDRIPTGEVATDCPMCLGEFIPIYYDDLTARFWHEHCLKGQGVAIDQRYPFYPRHFVQIAQTLGVPKELESPKKVYTPKTPRSWKKPFIKTLVIAFLVISFVAFVVNLVAFRSKNPFLYVVGLPFFLLAKLLFFVASGLKTILTDV